ncbi:MAG: SIS domain-containing protein [Bdellovibrionota bacterium]
MAKQKGMKNNGVVDVVAEFVRVLKLEADAIANLVGKLGTISDARDEVQGSVELLRKVVEGRGKIIVTGIGKSGKIAQKIASTLASAGSMAVYLHPTDGLHGDLGMVDAKDVILALSQTGTTSELVRLLPSFQSLAVPIIGIGGQRDSPLGRACRHWIDTSVEQEACPLGLAPTTSSTLALAVGDALAVALMKARGIDVDTFARNHPGGSLGWKTRKVREVMKTGDALAWAAPFDTMTRCFGFRARSVWEQYS